MTSDEIYATMTSAMWREEHLWNVGVLQRGHLSNLVIIRIIKSLFNDAFSVSQTISSTYTRS
jgi:hypothetical protein